MTGEVKHPLPEGERGGVGYSEFRIPHSELRLLPFHEPFIGKGEELIGMDCHAPDLVAVRGEVRKRPEIGIGILLRPDRMQLAVDGPGTRPLSRTATP